MAMAQVKVYVTPGGIRYTLRSVRDRFGSEESYIKILAPGEDAWPLKESETVQARFLQAHHGKIQDLHRADGTKTQRFSRTFDRFYPWLSSSVGAAVTLVACVTIFYIPILGIAFFAVGAGCLASSYFAFTEAQEGARSRRTLE